MQCHKCPKSVTNGGAPDEGCLTCKGADYLSNGFHTVTPVDDINKVQQYADPTFNNDSALSKDGDLIEYSKDKTKRNLEDCEKVLGVLKDCHHTSFKHIACMVAVFLSLGANSPILANIISGGSFSDYAKVVNTTTQNISQTWNRIVKSNPIMKKVAKGKKRKILI